jgi:peptide/nickel transport system substrate-binding protein
MRVQVISVPDPRYDAACSARCGQQRQNGAGGTAMTSRPFAAIIALVAASLATVTAPSQAATPVPLSTVDRSKIKPGGTVTWAISQTIPNFNLFERDGLLPDTQTIVNAMLPRPFHYSASDVPTIDTDYFTSITTTSASPLTISYKINPKAKWSDGTPITWEDLNSLWQAVNGTNAKYRPASTTGWNRIKSVTKGSDDQEAIVKFSTTYTDWRTLFDPLVPKSLTSTPDAFNKAWVSKPAVTAGPFKWGSENKTAHSYTIVRDPNWWGDKAELDSITFVIYNDPSAAVRALGSKDLDIDNLSVGDVVGNVQAVKQFQGITTETAAGTLKRQFMLNTVGSALSDVKVREAVLLGIDRQQITTALIGKLGGNPTPLQNYVYLKNQAAYQRDCGQYCNYDAVKAQGLLESDGWKLNGDYYEKNGSSLSLSITIPTQSPNSKAEAEIAQSTLKAAGIKLSITIVPVDDFFAKYIQTRKFQLTTFSVVGAQSSISDAMTEYDYAHRRTNQNFGSGGSAQIDLLLNKATKVPSGQADEVGNTASAALFHNAAWIPLYQVPAILGIKSTLVNLNPQGYADIRYQDIGYHA